MFVCLYVCMYVLSLSVGQRLSNDNVEASLFTEGYQGTSGREDGVKSNETRGYPP